MNIFLLFITTMLMIGYYVLYSPSQNLPHIESDSVIAATELQDLAGRVVTQHTAFLTKTEEEFDNIKYDDITSCYFCLNSADHSAECDTPSAIYGVWLTHSQAHIPENKYNDMIEIISKIYSWHPIGILKSRDIGNDDSIYTKDYEHKTVPDSLIDTANENGCTLFREDKTGNSMGQLIYFSKFSFVTEIENFEVEEDSGTGETNAECRAFCLNRGFFGGEMNKSEDSSTRTCRFLPRNKCICYDYEEECAEDQKTVFCNNATPPRHSCKSCNEYCQEHGALGANEEIESAIGCSCSYDGNTSPQPDPDPEDENDENPCPTYTHIGYKATSTVIGKTLQQINACGPCQTLKKDQSSCIQYCVPNTTMVNNRTCLGFDTEEGGTFSPNCTGDKEAIYFAFGPICGTQGLTDEEKANCSFPDVISYGLYSSDPNDAIEKIKGFVSSSLWPTDAPKHEHLGERIFRCMHCPNGVKYEESLGFMTVTCK